MYNRSILTLFVHIHMFLSQRLGTKDKGLDGTGLKISKKCKQYCKLNFSFTTLPEKQSTMIQSAVHFQNTVQATYTSTGYHSIINTRKKKLQFHWSQMSLMVKENTSMAAVVKRVSVYKRVYVASPAAAVSSTGRTRLQAVVSMPCFLFLSFK